MTQDPQPKPPRGPLLPLLTIGLLTLLVGVVTFLFSFGWFLPVVATLFGLVVFHYLAWGWWLGRMVREDVAKEQSLADADDQAAAQRPHDPPSP